MFKLLVMMEKVLRQLHYSSSSPSSYDRKETVCKAAKALYPKIARRKVGTWLNKRFTYIIHKLRYHLKANRVFAEIIGY